MARDRKRAKQRRQRQQRAQPPAGDDRSDERDRSSDVEPAGSTSEVSGDAKLAKEAIAGADIDQVDSPVSGDRATGAVYADELTGIEGEGVLSQIADTGDKQAKRAREREPAAVKPPREGNRVWLFLKACWAELKRVQWPDRRAVGQATGVVLVFVVIAGTYLGLLDYVWAKVVNLIL